MKYIHIGFVYNINIASKKLYLRLTDRSKADKNTAIHRVLVPTPP